MPPVISASRVAMTPPWSSIQCLDCSSGLLHQTRPIRRVTEQSDISQSGHVQAAVDRDVRPRDVAGLFGGEVGDEARDLLGLREPPHGNLLDDRLQDLRSEEHTSELQSLAYL